ncbi:family 78 glycoside hydrolase catalytic domain [Prevotella sp. HCN-7019]|uniref:family 78 glycoside hydrolase catalytic domain n=1 Tax=Prevotella sp. HCN-7019 TaxID=3134668 RepID=UPI0030C32C76
MKQNYILTRNPRLWLLMLGVLFAGVAHALTVEKLRTLSLTNPVGIDKAPTFSWILQSDERGVMQKSYRIIVCSDSDCSNIVWDSGVVESDQSVMVSPNHTFAPSTRYYWKVTVTDNKGNEATSTEKAYFETGLMGTGWDGAKWIRYSKNPLGYIDENEISDYSISCKFEIAKVAAGLCFGMTDENNYYMWQFNTEGDYPRFRPHRWLNNSPSCLEDVDLTGIIDLKNNEEYTLRIDITDNGMLAKTYINDILIDERRGDFPFGRIGFRAARSEYTENLYEAAYYDDFDISVDGVSVFTEDFSEGNSTFTAGSVKGGRLYFEGTESAQYCWQKEGAKGSARARLTRAADSAKGYAIESDITLMKGNVGVVFAYTASNNYYMWALNCKDYDYPAIRRHVYSNSTTPSYSDTRIDAFTKDEILGKPHRMRIEVIDNTVKTYIDGQLVDTYTASGKIVDGYTGFRTHADDEGPAYADNVKVTTISADDNETVRLSEDFEGNAPMFDGTITEHDGSNQLYVYTANGEQRFMESSMGAASMFRKEFTAKAPVKSAKLYSSALGIYDVFINGTRVGHVQDDGTTIYDELKPGWTDYAKKVFYNTHDVTTLVKEGGNAIGATVTSGYWAGGICHGQYGDKTVAFMAKLVIEYTDGSKETVVTDASWATYDNGALRKGDIYNGETYNATLEDSWTKAGYDQSAWHAIVSSRDFTGEICAFEGPAARIRTSLTRLPEHITIYEGIKQTGTAYGMVNIVSETSGNSPVKLKKGQTVIYDFGQNMVGWVRVNVKGKAGCTLRARFSEMLNDKGDTNRGDDGPGGSLYLINLRTAKASMYYTLRGDEEGETYSPTNTYYGFRYCEITAGDDIEINGIEGLVVGADNEEGSSLTTSHDAVNQLYSNVIWGQRGNFMSVPTDCPQRDERLGWTGDTQIFCRTAAYNANTAAFYHKFMGDMRDSQRPDGAYPDVAPIAWVGYGNGAWGDAGIIVPWTTYLMHGDKSIIEENYESMEKYMDWMAAQAGDGYKYQGAGTNYGDWVSFVPTDSRYVSVCYYAYDALLMSKMSQVLSKAPGDEYAIKAAEYEQLYNNIKAEFATRYISNRLPKQHTQTGYLLALRFGLLPDEASEQATIKALARAISSNNETLNTGFVGTGIINTTLSQVGLIDKAYNLLLQRNCPSWLYSVDQGATTIWERWNSYTKETGFHKDISMNSFNHYSYGAVAEWMYRYMAGIEADEQNAGFKNIILQPYPDTRTTLPQGQERITSVDATVASNYGSIKSAWQLGADGSLSYKVTVPANTTARLLMPVAEGSKVYEGSRPAEESEGVKYEGTTDDRAVFTLGSGSYSFTTNISTDISAVETENGIRVYPNPTDGVLHIESDEPVTSLTLNDMAGHLVSKAEGKCETLDLSSVNTGMYLLTVNTQNSQKTSKIIKK